MLKRLSPAFRSNVKSCLLLTLALFVDVLSIGYFGCRLIHLTRIAYIVTLFLAGTVVPILFAACCTALVTALLYGSVIDELCLAALLAVVSSLLAMRTLSTRFVKTLTVALLVSCWVLASHILYAGGLPACWWTIMQIIANIIISCLVMKMLS